MNAGILRWICFLSVLTQTTLSLRAQGTVIISEFMADNRSVLTNSAGQFYDWIELHNPSAMPVNMDGYYLTDDPGWLTKWAFPAVTLQPNEYRVVFASGLDLRDPAGELHTSFQLNAGGEFLALVLPDGVSFASLFSPEYPALKADTAYGISQKPIAIDLTSSSVPQILVPANAAALPGDWNTAGYQPDANWITGLAPAAIGFDTGQVSGAMVNLARTGTPAPVATQSSDYNSTFTADKAINGDTGDFTHTASADANPSWTLNLQRRAQIHTITIHNRDSCCGSRLRDITVQILDDDGSTVQYTSELLNPENAGFTFPGGPDNLVLDLTSQPVLGQYVKITRTPDPDLSGTGGQGNDDEGNVLSLGEVIVMGTDAISYHAFITTDLETAMLGQNASAFVRLPFTVADPAALDVLTLDVRYDDGFIAYLNGVKVLERNAPAVPAWNATATVDRPIEAGMARETINLNSALPHLVAGANVLAIHALNVSPDDANFLLEPKLTALNLDTSAYAFLDTATPGAINDTGFYLDEVADTRFSVDRGFFDAPFSLSITSATPGAIIYYSVNGDEPGPEKGIEYSGPLTISNTTVLRARAFKDQWKPTDVDTQTYLFLADVIHQSPNGQTPPNFPASWGRNRVDYGMDPQIVNQYTEAEWREALTQIPTLSIVTEMENLFDPSTGIYANADGHGILWERPASIELIDTNGTPQGRFQENGGLRIRGGYSRNPQFVKHSLRFFFRRRYGAPKLHYPLFEDEGADTFDTFDLRTSQNYSWPREGSGGTHETLVRDLFCRETLGAMGQPYTRSRYYHLYLNGHYWGIYMTQERAEASYGETYLGGNKEDYDAPKCGNHQLDFKTEATDGDLVAWSNLWSKCLSLPANPNNANYFEILGRNADGTRNPALPVLLDVDNLIDYMLEIFYSGDGDATLSSFLSNNKPNNWFSMRNRKDPNQGFHFFNQDSEHTMGVGGRSPIDADRTGPFGGSNQGNFEYSNPQWFHEELMSNPEYKLRFADHVQRHFFHGGALTPEAGTNRFLTRANQIDKAIRAYAARWGDANQAGVRHSVAEWVNEINYVVNSWFPVRTGILLQQLKNDGLYPAITAPEFSQLGGEIAAGFQLSLYNSNATGTIYYTLDGSDPRAVGGAVGDTAQVYSAPVTLNVSTRVKARIRSGSTWSALSEADYVVPGLSALRITELMYHPAPVTAADLAAGFNDADDFEYIELRNVGAVTLNLGGIQFVNGVNFQFNGGALAPGERVLLVKNLAAFNHRYGASGAIAGTYSGKLNNAGERLVVLDVSQHVLHDFSYADGWYPITDGFGFSLVIADDTAPLSTWNNKASWRPSGAFNGSAGATEPAPPAFPLVYVNEVLSRPASGELVTVELVNRSGAAADVSGWWLSDDFRNPYKFRIPASTMIPAGGTAVFTETDFGPAALGVDALNVSPAGAEIRLFSADATGQLTGYYQGWDFGPADEGVSFGRHVNSAGADHFVAQTAPSLGQDTDDPRVGPVVISEIMYRPPDVGGFDNTRDEYVEVLNVSTNVVLLYDALAPSNTWHLAGGVDFALPAGVSLAPGESLLFVSFDPAAVPAALADFRNLYGVPEQVPVFGPYSGKLDNSRESVELRKPTLLPTGQPAWVLMEKVTYKDEAPWPAGADGYGPSLHRLTATAYGNEPTNWIAAGALPGQPYVPTAPPDITQPPEDQTVVELTSATFSVGVAGSGPFTYVWRFNGGAIPGGTNATLTLDTVQVSDQGTYSVAVLNGAGAIALRAANLTVLRAPQITTQPQDVAVSPGATVMFSVVASGTGELSYQWFHNGAPISTGVGPILTVANAQLFENDGAYSVAVTDAVGTRHSEPAELKVLVAPLITAQPTPTNQTVLEGRTFSISISAFGTLPISYRWRRIGRTYTTLELYSTNCVLTVDNAKPGVDDIFFDVAIVNEVGRVLRPSDRAYVTIVPAAPFFAVEPTNQTAFAGAEVSLVSEARGTDPITYQWYLNQTNALPGATNASLVLSNLTAAAAGDYQVVAANSLGAVTSEVAQVSLALAPAITRQPAPQSVTPCATAVFDVEASGVAPLTYQWFFNSTNRLPEATSATLTITQPRLADAGDYTVVVANDGGSVTSTVAALTLVLDDCDGDGMSDQWEMAHGLNPADASDRDLDPDHDGRTNWEESLSGTDPYSATSVLTVRLANGGASGATIQFNAEPGIGYTIQYRSSLSTGAWATLHDVPPEPTAHTVEYTDPDAVTDGNRYYRIVTPMQ